MNPMQVDIGRGQRPVIPAQAGIQTVVTFLDPRLRGDDGFLPSAVGSCL
jgi:hypothetical protein